MKVTVRDEIEGTIRKRQHVWMKQKCFDFKNLSLYKLNFCLIRTKCAPQSKSSVRPAAAIYSRDKCDRSHIHVTQMFYIHVTLCFIFRGQAYMDSCENGERWLNVQVLPMKADAMFRWDKNVRQVGQFY